MNTEFHQDWQWGVLHFDGLLGLHGHHLCFHCHPDPTKCDAMVDPAKPIMSVAVPQVRHVAAALTGPLADEGPAK